MPDGYVPAFNIACVVPATTGWGGETAYCRAIMGRFVYRPDVQRGVPAATL